ncbi:hypothetical protein LFM09_28550 [Lentzea alba]|uniref:hypothetical protein n=1 Tax=Lentzea alba TaxID=2714351 RepID=UPI0039BF4580
MSKFEDNLWVQLERDHGPALVKNVVTHRRRNAGRWMAAAAVAAVLGTGAVVAPSYFGGTPPAYGVVDNPDGSVTLTIKEVEQVYAAAAALRERGIPVIAVPRRDGCPDIPPKVSREPVLLQDMENDPIQFLFQVSGTAPGSTLELRVKIRPDRFPPGTTWVLAEPEPNTVMGYSGFYPSDRLPSCIPTDWPR